MIIGIGTDIVENKRIKQLLDEHDEKSLFKVYTKEELQKKNIEHLAGIFAAKESLSKAFGTGLGGSLWFSDIEVMKEESGKPYFKLNDKIKKLLKKFKAKKIHLSISHEKDFSIAFVVIES